MDLLLLLPLVKELKNVELEYQDRGRLSAGRG